MAKVTLYYLDGRVQTYNNVRVSKKNRMYHIWNKGKYVKGSKPIISVRYSDLHAKSRTGKKGIHMEKDY